MFSSGERQRTPLSPIWPAGCQAQDQRALPISRPLAPDQPAANSGGRTLASLAARAAAVLAVVGELGAHAVELVVRQHVGLAELDRVPVLRGEVLDLGGELERAGQRVAERD